MYKIVSVVIFSALIVGCGESGSTNTTMSIKQRQLHKEDNKLISLLEETKIKIIECSLLVASNDASTTSIFIDKKGSTPEDCVAIKAESELYNDRNKYKVAYSESISTTLNISG
jgi:major membrane immunogen (membrane-anchored lipoprotein)